MKVTTSLDLYFDFDEEGCAKLHGHLKQLGGQRIMLGLEAVPETHTVDGMVWSHKGFWFAYLTPLNPLGYFELVIRSSALANRRVRAFIKLWRGEGAFNIEMDSVSTETVFIIGSCVSRDGFELSDAPTVENYVARSSFVSSMSDKPSGFEDEDLSKNTSAFQRRMVEFDLNRRLPNILASRTSPVVLVDFVDERFPLLQRNGNWPITYSPEFRTCEIEAATDSLLETSGPDYYLNFTLAWARFVHSVNEESIVINKVFWATEDDNGNTLPNQQLIKENNEKLEKLYEIVQTISPNVTWFLPSSKLLVADSSHQWGASPYHYVKDFEVALIDFVSSELKSAIR